MSKILLVEDDILVAGSIQGWMEREKYICQWISTGSEAKSILKHYQFEMIILDWELPDCTGLDILTEYRASGGQSPVLMLTGRQDINDKLACFQARGDDYLTKPFHAKELMARVTALLRRPQTVLQTNLRAADFELDRAVSAISYHGQRATLLPRELMLMSFLMKYPEQLFTSEAILERVWPNDSEATNLAVVTCVKRIRRKLESIGAEHSLINIHSRGYGFFPAKV